MESQSEVHNDARPLTKTPLFAQFAAPFRLSRAFPYLWLGHLISVLGSSVSLLLLPVIVYTLTGSSTVMGFILAAFMLPNILMLPVSGWLVDRYNRINIMLLTDAGRFVLMLILTILLFTDSLNIPLLTVIVAIYGAMDGLFNPAYSAVRASVFTEEIRNSANAITQISNQAVKLIGPSLGGVLVTFMSAGWGIGLDALTYAASFICIFHLRRLLPYVKKLPASGEKSSVQGDFKEGIQVLRSNPWLWVTILAFSFVNICFGGLVAVLVPWLFKVHLELDPYVYGVAVTCAGVGAIVAGLLFGSRSHWRHRGILAYGGALISGIALLGMSMISSGVGLCILFAVEGFGIMVFALIWETSLQELVPQEIFGRVASLDMLGSFALLPFGYILIGWLADHIGGTVTIAMFSGMGILAVLLILLHPAIRKFD